MKLFAVSHRRARCRSEECGVLELIGLLDDPDQRGGLPGGSRYLHVAVGELQLGQVCIVGQRLRQRSRARSRSPPWRAFFAQASLRLPRRRYPGRSEERPCVRQSAARPGAGRLRDRPRRRTTRPSRRAPRAPLKQALPREFAAFAAAAARGSSVGKKRLFGLESSPCRLQALWKRRWNPAPTIPRRSPMESPKNAPSPQPLRRRAPPPFRSARRSQKLPAPESKASAYRLGRARWRPENRRPALEAPRIGT